MKVLKWIGISVASIFTLGFVGVMVGAVFFAGEFDSYRQKAMQAEAKLQLAMAYQNQKMHWVEFETYSHEAMETTQRQLASDTQHRPRYKVALAGSGDPIADRLCPDCKANKTTFKLVSYGNLDDDETLDVWTIDQDNNVVHQINDIEL